MKETNLGAIIAILVCLFSFPIKQSMAAGLVKQSSNLSNPKNYCDAAERGNFGAAVALGDLDNDGYDDMLVAASGTNYSNEYAYLYYSQGNGNFESPITLDIGRPTGLAFGDVNSDGIKDAIVVSSYGQVCAFYGNTTRYTTTRDCNNADWRYSDDNPFGSGGPSGLDIADLNADGIDDIVVGAPQQDRMIAFYGSVNGLPDDHSPDVDIHGDTGLDSSQGGVSYRVGGLLGSAVAKDGNYCDANAPTEPCGSQFVTGVPNADIDLNGNGILAAGEINIGVALVGPRWQFLSGDKLSGSQFGYELGHAGDVNGDGESDLLISSKATSTTTPKSFLYLGKSDGFAKMNLEYSWAVEPASKLSCGIYCETFGAVVGTAGDINGDGYSDIFISDYRYDLIGGRSQTELGYWGRAYIWYGGPSSVEDPTGLGVNPTPATADITISGTGRSGGFGESYATGDINGDGYSDIVVGDPRGADFCFDSSTGSSKFAEVGLVWVYMSDYSPNLKLNKTATPTPASYGHLLTYNLSILNDGNSAATGVVLKDQLPEGVTFNSVVATQGSCTGPDSSGEISCTLGTVSAHASASVTIEVIPNVIGTIVNSASVKANEPDYNHSDNKRTITTQVVKYGDISVTKSVSPDPVYVGNALTYTIVVNNHSSDSATNVVVTDVLSEQVMYSSYVATQGSCIDPDPVSYQMQCELGNLTGGQAVTITIQVVPQSPGDIVNQVSVSSAEQDSNPSNNSDSVSVTANIPNTPPGSDIEVDSGKGVDFTFSNVTEGGDTSVTTSDDNPGPTDPNFDVRGSYYDIQTTASFDGEVEVCFSYDDTGMTFAQELSLRIFHLVDGSWESIELTQLDFVNNVICGKVTSFSWFGVGMVKDTDGDTIGDDIDNCTLVSNIDQRDTDGDGFGNICDADLNNDGATNFVDFAIFRKEFGKSDSTKNQNEDFNGDGVVNFVDFAIFRDLFGKTPGPSYM